MKEKRKYWVVTLAPGFKVKSLVVGLDRANLLVEKNKDTLEKYEIPGSVFIRRIKRKRI